VRGVTRSAGGSKAAATAAEASVGELAIGA
jgi:hypothetical protein